MRGRLLDEARREVERIYGISRRKFNQRTDKDEPLKLRTESLDAMPEWVLSRFVELKIKEDRNSEYSKYIASMLNKLSKTNQTVVTQRYFQGEKFASIAKKLGITESAVCHRHKEALMSMRTSLSILVAEEE